MKTALFAGSFDPFTRGHAAVVEDGLRIFDRIIIGIGTNTLKNGLLTVENRRRLIDEVYRDNDRVECIVYDELTGELCRRMQVDVLLRGVRNATDCEYERSIADVNRMLFPEVTTVMVFAPAQYAAVSSSIIRELLRFGGDVSAMLPENIDINKFI